MFHRRRRRGSKKIADRSGQLHFEVLEDRRMLTTMADIVFVVDESGSVGSAISWLSDLVTGNRDLDPEPEVDSLSQQLANSGITDIRYGLVGYASQRPAGGFSLGHSHVVGTDPGKTVLERLWSDGLTAIDHVDDLTQAIQRLIHPLLGDKLLALGCKTSRANTAGGCEILVK